MIEKSWYVGFLRTISVFGALYPYTMVYLYFALSFLFIVYWFVANTVDLKRMALHYTFAMFTLSFWMQMHMHNLNTRVFKESYWFQVVWFNNVHNYNMDPMSLSFVNLSHFLIMICVLILWNLKYRFKEAMILLFFINFFMMHAFSTLDMLYFYIYFEAILMPMFLLMGIWGSRESKVFAAYQFFLYTLLGSVFMLLAFCGYIPI